MKLLTSPLAIVLAGIRPYLSALEEPGNRGVMIPGGSLWERLWFSGGRTQNGKTKKRKGQIRAQQPSAGLGLNPRFLALFSPTLNRKRFPKPACEIR